jgi:hypothetical protein
LIAGAIADAVLGPVVPEIILLFLVFVICCCFGGWVDTLASDAGFVVAVVVCLGVDDDIDDDVCGVAVVVNDDIRGFTVRGIPHMRDSVALTTFRLGLLGSHIFALSSGDIFVVLSESADRDCGGSDDDCCCAYAWILLQIAKSNTPVRTENTAKIELLLLILHMEMQYYIYVN